MTPGEAAAGRSGLLGPLSSQGAHGGRWVGDWRQETAPSPRVWLASGLRVQMSREAPGHPSARAEKALGQRGGAALPEGCRQTAFSRASPLEVPVTRRTLCRLPHPTPGQGTPTPTCSDTPGHPRPAPSALSHYPLQGLSPGVGVSCRSQKDPCPTHRGPAGPGAPGAQTLTCCPGMGGSTLSACRRLGECMLDVRLMVRSQPDETSLTPRPVHIPRLEGG